MNTQRQQQQEPGADQATQGYVDLCARARHGLFVHFVLWLMVGTLGGFWQSLPRLCFAAAGLFALVVLLRLKFEHPLALRAATVLPARIALHTLMLASPLLWGVVGALSNVMPEMAQARTAIQYVMVGVAASGGVALAIDSTVRRAWPLLVMGPGTLALMANGDRTDYFLAAMSIAFILYIQRASRVVHADYWAAADANAQLAARARELERLSTTDALTQVRNRPHFDRQLAAEWARAGRSGESVALLMIDLDHFKRINDRCGHAFGDACLKAAAGALQAALFRPNDLLARYGGEEFVVFLPAIDPEGAAAVATRLCTAVARIAIARDGETVSLSCSVGLHVATVHGSSLPHAMAQADRAMYAAKHQGRNRVVSI